MYFFCFNRGCNFLSFLSFLHVVMNIVFLLNIIKGFFGGCCYWFAIQMIGLSVYLYVYYLYVCFCICLCIYIIYIYISKCKNIHINMNINKYLTNHLNCKSLNNFFFYLQQFLRLFNPNYSAIQRYTYQKPPNLEWRILFRIKILREFIQLSCFAFVVTIDCIFYIHVFILAEKLKFEKKFNIFLIFSR